MSDNMLLKIILLCVCMDHVFSWHGTYISYVNNRVLHVKKPCVPCMEHASTHIQLTCIIHKQLTYIQNMLNSLHNYDSNTCSALINSHINTKWNERNILMALIIVMCTAVVYPGCTK